MNTPREESSMAFGFPASAELVEEFPRYSPRELLDAVDDALCDLGWGHRYLGDFEFTAGTGFSFFSYGEAIRIVVYEDSSVRIQSRCSWPLQWFDWGKNRTNINDLLFAIERCADRIRRRRERRRELERVDEREQRRDDDRIQ
jgi:hypothetical protein